MMTIEELIMEIMPFLIMPFIIATVRVILHIILNIMRGDHIIEQKDTEINAAEEQKTEINIDKDLKKYFNYKE